MTNTKDDVPNTKDDVTNTKDDVTNTTLQWDGDVDLAHTEQQFFSSLVMLNNLVARNAKIQALSSHIIFSISHIIFSISHAQRENPGTKLS